MHRYIVDGPYLTYRSFVVALREGPEAAITACHNSTLSVVLDLLDLLDDPRDEVWVIWEHREGRGLELRRDIFPDYKCRRGPKPEGYRAALDLLQDAVLPPLGVHQAWPVQGEGDDAAATLAREEGVRATLWAADKDWLQLLTLPGAAVMVPGLEIKRGYLIRECNMAETHHGIPAERWGAYLALAGDGADDIPGMPGIGAKRAADLLTACPMLVELALEGRGDQAVQQVARVDIGLARWAQRVADQPDHLRTMVALVTLRDVPLERRHGVLDHEAATDALASLGLHWCVDRVPMAPLDDWSDDASREGADEWAEHA